MARFSSALVLCFLLLSHLVVAVEQQQQQEQAQEEQTQEDEQDEQVDGDGQDEQEGQAYQSGQQYGQNANQDDADYNADNADNNADENYKTEIEVCSDGVIQVKDISILCDSPGTFYYGSGKYRNSPSCLPGDKAQIRIDFYIAQPEVIANNGNYALVDIAAYGGGWFSGSKTIYESADLCSLSTLKSRYSQCPYAGNYYIKTHFYWEESNGYSNSKFYPKLTVGFKSSLNKVVYDYGGANTDLCSGSTFITWSDNIAIAYANAIGNFVKTFGILLLTIAFLGSFMWILVNRPTSFKDARRKLSGRNDGLLDDEFDFSKMRRGGPTQDVLDF